MVKASKGHLEHSKSADNQRGLSGKIKRKIKIVMLGAGSGFTPTLMHDISRIPGIQGGSIGLVDIDLERLSVMEKLITKVMDEAPCEAKWEIIATDKRKEVLKDAEYIINCIEVSGVKAVKFDNDIPLEYGVDQCIGDTVGPGGLFKGLRTVPVLLEILKDCEKFCPKALFLNYTNPMSVLCLSAFKSSPIQLVGMCHSVQHTSHQLANWAEVPFEEMVWECAGVNHLAWFTRLEHQGKNLYPRLREKFTKDLEEAFTNPEAGQDLVRKDMMLHFGAFITESSGHLSEYLPFYRTNPELMKKYIRAQYDGESGFYSREWPKWREAANADRLKMLKGKIPVSKEKDGKRSWEYASWIIEAIEKKALFQFHGTVTNQARGAGALIANLPHENVVETACIASASGITPQTFGKLPPQMAAICRSHAGFYEMAALAAIHKSKEMACQALMLDPYTSAVCTPAQIKEMALRLFKAEEDLLPGYC